MQAYEGDRFREVQKKYPSLKNLDFEQLKPFRDAYDEYMTVKGLYVELKSLMPENENQTRQEVAVIMNKIKDKKKKQKKSSTGQNTQRGASEKQSTLLKDNGPRFLKNLITNISRPDMSNTKTEKEILETKLRLNKGGSISPQKSRKLLAHLDYDALSQVELQNEQEAKISFLERMESRRQELEHARSIQKNRSSIKLHGDPPMMSPNQPRMMAMSNRVSELRKSQEKLSDNQINLGEINIENNE